MATKNVEQRLTDLEAGLNELSRRFAGNTAGGDWRSTLGMFGDDPGMRELLRGAERIREEDRRLTRPAAKPRKAKR